MVLAEEYIINFIVSLQGSGTVVGNCCCYLTKGHKECDAMTTLERKSPAQEPAFYF